MPGFPAITEATMADYQTFCKHYGYDPQTAEARKAYADYQDALSVLQAAAAKGENRG